MTDPTATDLEHLCATLFVGSNATWAGSLSFADHPDAVPTSCLDDKALFDDLVGRFGQAHPGADRQAVMSFWSQFYFARLTIVLTTFCLAADRPLPLDFAGLKVRFCPQKGTPLCFHLGCGGPARPADALVRSLYDEQIAGTVACLKRHSGLSARLYWENVGSYGMWILGEMARLQAAPCPAADLLLADLQWPRTGCTMLPHMKSAAREARPAERRVCCLRYRLPGVSRCVQGCPLSAEVTPALA
ncbi:siderophore-iron reductase FhuF [Lichenihabitans sp. Uapishka_5]|uniref:siderophore-iron reductase FhuF n=1 Tax=Lichenihabitans sp. Uapishka_5 TaxID=3037302 RepID=UPI0029E81196|nr:siderophore-iron reductase FhuF [Lichenihabitans sp. Uapishka_5]MDX7951908.1 siderophore-iron reductase FhuF [Lichenihabitans sp. Uapishka_5]